MSAANRMRTVEHRGEIYVARDDLLQAIANAARGMVDPHDQAVAENLVRFLVEASRSEP